MRQKSLLLSLALLFIPFLTFAQTVGNLRLQKDYFGTVDAIADGLSADLNVRFIFDREHLSAYRTVIVHADCKTLNAFLKKLEESWDMKTRVGDDGYIYIARDSAHLEQLMNRNVESKQAATVEKRTVRSAVDPVKRNFTLTGEVADERNGERIPYATITVEGTMKGCVTDANGRFTMHGVPADTVEIAVSYLGYIKKIVELEPSEDNPALFIELEPQKQEIAEVFVFGRKDDKALEQSVGEHKIKMSPAALKFLPNIGEKDIMRSFQLMPGVSASNENSSGMFVRGGTPDQNLIVYDGFTVYYVDHLYGFYSAFNSNAIKDVQLYKGGFEAKYGGRLSSVTEITGKDGNNRKVSFGGDVSLLSVNAFLEVPIAKKVTTLVAFRRSYQGWMYNRISGQKRNSDDSTDSGMATGRPGPMGVGDSGSEAKSYFYDINAKVTYNATDRDIISVSFFNGADYLDNTPTFGFGGGGGMGGGMGGGGGFSGMSMDNSDYTRYGNIGVSGRWTRRVNEKLTSTVVASWSKFYSDRDESREITVTNEEGDTNTFRSGILEDNNLSDISLSTAFKYELNENHTFEFGAFGTYYDIDYSYAQSDTLKLVDKRDDAFLAGAYFQDRMRFANRKLVVTPGLRMSYFGNTGKPYFEPRLGTSWSFAPNFTLNGATGLFYQFANRVTREDVMSGNTDFWILSNRYDIPVSSSVHVNLGLNYDLPGYLFSVDAYYKKNYDITEYTMRFQRSLSSGGFRGQSGMEASEEFFTGDGYSVGMEFLAQKKAGKFSGWVSYTIGEVKNRFPGQSDKWYYASQDVTHEFKAVGVYKFGNWDFSATWIYSTGRPYTAPLGGYSLELVDGTTENYYAVSDKNTFRLPDYHRLDLAVSFRFDLFGSKGKAHSVSVSVFNVYDRKNVSAKKFEIVDGAILESNINYLSITPNATLSVRF